LISLNLLRSRPTAVEGDAVVELGTVGQAGEGVEARQIGEPRLLCPPLGDVLDCGDPAARSGHHMGEGNHAVSEDLLA
jgi:hypothetical protein